MGLIFLTGMPGAGKSTIGSLLAQKLRWRFLDLDAEIERREASTIEDLFSKKGEAGFRAAESAALTDAFALSDAVVALGAGALDDDSGFDRVKSAGTLVYLRAPMSLLLQRNHGSTSRPLLKSAESDYELRGLLDTLLSRREARYMAASIVVDQIAENTPSITVARLLESLNDHASG